MEFNLSYILIIIIFFLKKYMSWFDTMNQGH
jgi:hypothetical protein